MGLNLTPSLESSITSGRVIVRVDTNILKRAPERIVAQQKMDIFHFVFQGCLTKPLLPHSPSHPFAIGFWVCVFHSYCENYQLKTGETYYHSSDTRGYSLGSADPLSLPGPVYVPIHFIQTLTRLSTHPPLKGPPTSILASVLSSKTQLPNNVTQINPKHRPSIRHCRYIPHFRVNQT